MKTITLFSGRPSGLILVKPLFYNSLFGVLAIFLYHSYFAKGLAVLETSFPVQFPVDIIAWLLWVIWGLFLFRLSYNIVIGGFRRLALRYHITNHRVQDECGIFIRKVDNLELSRVLDIQLTQPLVLRLFGCGNITLISTDQSSPRKILYGLPRVHDVMGTLTEWVKPRR